MNLTGFDLNLLKVLNALLEDGSTTAAGRRIGLSQPAVSAALGRLRHALDDPLFVRQGRRLVATQRALALRDPLQQLLSETECLLTGPATFDPARAQARFRLSGSDYFVEMLMPRLGARVARAAPGIFLHFVDLVPDNYVDTLETYQVDIALIPKPDLASWCDWQTLGTSLFVVIARKGHPLLARHGVQPGGPLPMDLYCAMGHILFSVEGKAHGTGDAALAEVGRKRRVVMTLPSFYGVHSVVAGSDHVALVPGEMAERLAGRMGLDIYQPPMKIRTAEIGMIWHRRHGNAPAHRWLRQQIAACVAPIDETETGQDPNG